MEIVYENIRKRRKEIKMTQAELADRCGYKDHTTINAIEHGKIDISLGRLKQIATALGTTPRILLGWGDEVKKIPVLGRIAAGTLTESIEDAVDYVEIPKKWHGDYFALKVRGSSMAPRILEDDILIVLRQPDAESGDIVVAQVKGAEATVKKLLINTNGITLQPLNSEFEPLFFTDEQQANLPVKILGRVIECRHEF